MNFTYPMNLWLTSCSLCDCTITSLNQYHYSTGHCSTVVLHSDDIFDKLALFLQLAVPAYRNGTFSVCLGLIFLSSFWHFDRSCVSLLVTITEKCFPRVYAPTYNQMSPIQVYRYYVRCVDCILEYQFPENFL